MKVGVDVSVKVRLLRANGGVLLYPVELFFRDGKQQCSSFFEASLFRAGEKVKPLVLIIIDIEVNQDNLPKYVIPVCDRRPIKRQ